MPTELLSPSTSRKLEAPGEEENFSVKIMSPDGKGETEASVRVMHWPHLHRADLMVIPQKKGRGFSLELGPNKEEKEPTIDLCTPSGALELERILKEAAQTQKYRERTAPYAGTVKFGDQLTVRYTRDNSTTVTSHTPQ